jgi:hypothetical protein
VRVWRVKVDEMHMGRPGAGARLRRRGKIMEDEESHISCLVPLLLPTQYPTLLSLLDRES